MRISDWSSDVCSSDLPDAEQHEQAREDRRRPAEEIRRAARRHQARRAPAHAEATALRTLHEDDGHQGGADDSLQDKEESEHRKPERSEEHTSELQSLMRISYDVLCLTKKQKKNKNP